MATAVMLAALALAPAVLGAQTVGAVTATSPEAEAIITRLESRQNPPQSAMEGSMTLKDRFGTRTITFSSWAKGDTTMLITFTSDAEYGQKILRLGKDLYLYYPDAQKTIPVRGSAMGDSVMGSDMSYEDLTGNKGLLANYHVQVAGTETIQGSECWVLDLKAKSRDVPWDAQKLWVSKDRSLTMQIHQFARSGRLVRTIEMLDFVTSGSWTMPKRTIIKDQLKKNSSTEFSVLRLDLDSPIADSRFSLKELGK